MKRSELVKHLPGAAECARTDPVTDADLEQMGLVPVEQLEAVKAAAISTITVTQEALVEQGYVKLDVDAMVEEIVIGVDNCFEPSISEQPEGDAWLDDIAREVKLAVLAALDKGANDV